MADMASLMALPRGAVIGVVVSARSVVGQAVEAAAALATLPVRVFQVLGSAELLVTRMTVLAEQAEDLVGRTAVMVTDIDATAVRARGAVEHVETIAAAAALTVREAAAVAAAAAKVVDGADDVSAEAAAVVLRAGTLAGEADALLGAYAPTLRTAAPMASRFIEQVSHEELTAAIRIVDQLPRLLDHLTTDVLPILATMERVGPDIHSLLEATRDLQLAVAGIPGLKILRRRGEEKLSDEDD